jgi:hypothetical protein
MRLLLPFLLLAACDSVTTAPTTIPPLEPHRGATGRVILAIPELPYTVEAVHHTLGRRLAILGVEARITYDRRRVVIDLAGLPPAELPRLARVLGDPGHVKVRDGRGFSLKLDGELDRVEAGNAACACAARWRLALDPAASDWFMHAQPPLRVEQDGRALASLDRWVPAVEQPSPQQAPYIMGVDLLLKVVPAEPLPLMLALGGGQLPEPVSIVEATPAGAP